MSADYITYNIEKPNKTCCWISEQKSKINTVCFNDISFSLGTSSGYELHKNQHIFKRYKVNDAKLNYQKARNKKSNEQRKEFYLGNKTKKMLKRFNKK